MTELEQFKVILATLCLEDENMKLGTALVLAEQIQARMHTLPLEGAQTFTPSAFDEHTPHEVVDRWMALQTDLLSLPKIHGIKEIRARTGMGLVDAKKTYERAFGPGGALSSTPVT